ncbi:multi-sensor hybrid histidine kinase [Stanieria sp. NIES-3757]|nr:multi-sensor hybrid histidine kinase [Stanieria sp. NIES-3757]
MIERDSPFVGNSEMASLMRSLDWSATSLGSVEGWSQSLRISVSICLTSRFPILIWWGKELVMLYNDAYRPILGVTKHPQAMGQRGRDCWPEIWDVIGPMLEKVLTTGEATWSDDQLLLLNRNGYLEECYFTFSYSPIIDETGKIGGIFTAVTETTERVIGERRLRTLRELAAKTAEARTVEQAGYLSAQSLINSLADIPFALIYLLETDGNIARLVGRTGIEVGTPASPVQIDLTKSEAEQPWCFTEVQNTGEAQIINDLKTRFTALPRGSWSEPPHSAIVMPILQSGQKQQLVAFLILGISPRKEFDDQYRGFFELITSHVATAIADADTYAAERKRAEELAELDRAKTIFFSNISHEFRTPLTLMLGPLEDLLAENNSSLSQAHQEQLKIVHRNALRLLKLVNSLLDFSRIEAGRIQAIYEPTDLARLTTNLAGVFRSAIERVGLRFQVDCPPLPEPIYVDREMWEKIILNLLSNAFKYTFAGEICVNLRWVEVDESTFSQAGVELEVRDTGTGIAAEELPNIFKRFHRVQEAKGRTYEGSGIGLSLVKELVQLHGGTIEVTSVVEQGSSFKVFVPAGYAHLPSEHISKTSTTDSTTSRAIAYVEEALRWLPATENEASEIIPAEHNAIPFAPFSRRSLPIQKVDQPNLINNSSSTQVLLADDNADMRDYLTQLLSSQGYNVTVVGDGMAALATVNQFIPDLVLTDIMMPRLDGLGLLQKLRENPATREIPIILLSARAEEETRIQGLETGADDYLIKPFSARELLARVEATLKLYRVRQQAQLKLEAKARELSELNHSLEHINNQLSQRNQELNRFTYIVSHDLKAPLRAIANLSTWIEEDLAEQLPEENQNQMELLRQRVQLMEALIDGLLQYSRIGRIEVRAEKINLAQLLTEVIDSLTPPATFMIQIKSLIHTMTAKRLLLFQVFSNLISNAIKHHHRDDGIIEISAIETKDYYQFAVADDGPGIAPEHHSRIFDIFQTLQPLKGKENTGIGLSIIKKIIDTEGGEIVLESDLNQGAIFRFTWPKQVLTTD